MVVVPIVALVHIKECVAAVVTNVKAHAKAPPLKALHKTPQKSIMILSKKQAAILAVKTDAKSLAV